jgi:hypothetical protein
MLLISGVLLKFTEPVDSAMPDDEWRLYTFKNNENQGKK